MIQFFERHQRVLLILAGLLLLTSLALAYDRHFFSPSKPFKHKGFVSEELRKKYNHGDPEARVLNWAPEEDFADIRSETDVDILLAILSESNEVEEERIGIGGGLSRRYICYQRLCSLIGADALYKLTFHQSPAVRTYAAWGLYEKDTIRYADVKRRLLTDTNKVVHRGGCVGSVVQVGAALR